MEDKKEHEDNTTPYTGKTHGPDGVDKAPGEETSQDKVQFDQESQKGKKVDGDPEEEADQPIEQTGLPE
ncbi:MAG: hypothetical protein Q7T76_06115 [Ferruginibacter sp.]|nr:hypothetical protein [Ferruginibacter sp.]